MEEKGRQKERKRREKKRKVWRREGFLRFSQLGKLERDGDGDFSWMNSNPREY